MIMHKSKILFLDSVHPCLKEFLEESGYYCDVETEISKKGIMQIINSYSGIVIRSRISLDREILEKADNLQFIARSGSGMENIDMEFASKQNILCLNAPEGNRDAVAEHAIGMLLTLFNKIIQGDRNVRNGNWSRENNRGIELNGKTVGIIGYGNTGSSLAKKLKGFNVSILAHDKYKSGFGSNEISECSLSDICDNADIISLHLPYTEETERFINHEFINACSRSFFLVNTSRGRIIDTEAVIEALNCQKISGACLDVLEYEGLSFESLSGKKKSATFKELTSMNNVILTPHVAGWTNESYQKLSSVLAKKISLAISEGKIKRP